MYNATNQSCSECPPRHVFDAGAGACTACARGQFYVDSTGVCEDCAAGTYAPTGNGTACLECPGAGTGGMPAAWHVDNCTTCGAGYFRGGGRCTACPAGTVPTGPDAARCECAAQGTARAFTAYAAAGARSMNVAVAAVHAAAAGGAHALLDFAVGTVQSDGTRYGLRVETIDSDGQSVLVAEVQFQQYNYAMQVFASSAQ